MNSNRVAAAAVAAIAVALFGATFWFDKMPEGITRGRMRGGGTLPCGRLV